MGSFCFPKLLQFPFVYGGPGDPELVDRRLFLQQRIVRGTQLACWSDDTVQSAECRGGNPLIRDYNYIVTHSSFEICRSL